MIGAANAIRARNAEWRILQGLEMNFAVNVIYRCNTRGNTLQATAEVESENTWET